MIDHLDEGNDESIIASLKTRLLLGTVDADSIAQELSAYRIQARDQAFGTTVTMNLLGEMSDIMLPPLHTDHYEDAWDKVAASVSATAAALQTRARTIAVKSLPFPTTPVGADGVQ
ncbi:hypothetical protein [Glycomyces tritici]|uniref:Uncharacterized protein n=1 Tax=Glycomyces tritici TaxID=2665176 RepID=A0ABT7YMR5_9ACTN|nr:hypothetical protein [Glycomyces tritici]MDN3239909.1 hypothetical protein [Glycomyces tritici]